MLGIYLSIMRKCGVYGKGFEKALLELDEMCRNSPDLWDDYDGEFQRAIEMVSTIKGVK